MLSNKEYVAGVGARKTPLTMIPTIQSYANDLVSLGFTLRSGGAEGADTYWEDAFDIACGKKEIYLPCPYFNKNRSPLYGTSEAARKIARQYHEKFDDLTPFVQELLTRNVFIVLGTDLKTPVRYLIGWTADGKASGGTGHAIRIAHGHNIACYNIYDPREKSLIDLTLKFWKEFR